MIENDKLTPRAKDQVLGCMVGGAVGDALGYAVEFESYGGIVKKYGEQGITRFQLDRRGVAEISDDTQMSLFTAAGILLGMTRGYMRGIMGRIDTYCHWTYLDWLHTQEWTSRHEDARVDSWLMDVPELYARRAPGNTCLSALHAIEEGREARNNSCGCGGVMRTAPLALLNQLHGYADGDKLYCDMCAAEAARITHKHPLGFIPSALLNDILMQILEGIEGKQQRPEYFVERALQRLPEIAAEVDEGKTYGELWPEEIKKQKRLIVKALDLAFTDIEDHYAIESIGGGWTGHEALAIAIYSATKHRDWAAAPSPHTSPTIWSCWMSSRRSPPTFIPAVSSANTTITALRRRSCGTGSIAAIDGDRRGENSPYPTNPEGCQTGRKSGSKRR